MSDHLKYYKKIKIAPTLDLKDLNHKILISQRKKFYFSLGLTKNSFENKKILELCCGTGYNMHFLKSQFKCGKSLVVDHNPNSIKLAKKNLSKYKDITVLDKDIRKFKCKKKFDYVLIENSLDNINNPQKIVDKIINLTKKDGNIIMTVGDNYGIFSEKLRFVYSIILLDQRPKKKISEKVYFLSNIFKYHLNTLTKNLRKPDKWVLDNILNENWIKKKNYYGVTQLIKKIKGKLIIQNVYPSFMEKKKFYKKINFQNINKKYLNTHINNQLNLLDANTQFDKFCNIETNIKNIYAVINKLSIDKKLDKKLILKIKIELENMRKKILKRCNKNNVTLMIEEFNNIIDDFMNDKKVTTKTKHLSKFWSVYNQHILLHKI